jgi:hypothetical protein
MGGSLSGTARSASRAHPSLITRCRAEACHDPRRQRVAEGATSGNCSRPRARARPPARSSTAGRLPSNRPALVRHSTAHGGRTGPSAVARPGSPCSASPGGSLVWARMPRATRASSSPKRQERVSGRCGASIARIAFTLRIGAGPDRTASALHPRRRQPTRKVALRERLQRTSRPRWNSSRSGWSRSRRHTPRARWTMPRRPSRGSPCRSTTKAYGGQLPRPLRARGLRPLSPARTAPRLLPVRS